MTFSCVIKLGEDQDAAKLSSDKMLLYLGKINALQPNNRVTPKGKPKHASIKYLRKRRGKR